MNSKQTAWVVGVITFVGMYVGLSVLHQIVSTEVFANMLQLLVCLVISTHIMDTIDPIK